MELGFELLREGDKIAQHIARFDKVQSPGYKIIPLKAFLVVDFCMTEVAKSRPLGNDSRYVRVNIDSNLKKGQVYYMNDKNGEFQTREIIFK